MSEELNNNVIRTISISAEQDTFLKNNKNKINFSHECRLLIDRLMNGNKDEEEF